MVPDCQPGGAEKDSGLSVALGPALTDILLESPLARQLEREDRKERAADRRPEPALQRRASDSGRLDPCVTQLPTAPIRPTSPPTLGEN
ncbi:hypothetical protein [Aurantiacibacter aquimixticola]|uniref:Uncharacterized protein n=1 Tax=Aurantiacibacter aquimixticola TaxID=1958945 RepID=A0A419RU02_9SPHN|nr:hypothetical protein [Aurantiacibacter aquimixticola]RJY09260.1 hypothetical protein D6201_07730 [Aurantiacibacter aquimixticola]